MSIISAHVLLLDDELIKQVLGVIVVDFVVCACELLREEEVHLVLQEDLLRDVEVFEHGFFLRKQIEFVELHVRMIVELVRLRLVFLLL